MLCMHFQAGSPSRIPKTLEPLGQNNSLAGKHIAAIPTAICRYNGFLLIPFGHRPAPYSRGESLLDCIDHLQVQEVPYPSCRSRGPRSATGGREEALRSAKGLAKLGTATIRSAPIRIFRAQGFGPTEPSKSQIHRCFQNNV